MSNVAQLEASIAALEEEKSGYQSRLAALKVGKRDRLDVDELGDRVKQVDAEIKRCKAALGKQTADEAA
jgi:uncharacterized small protein (DUF1192 family)